LHAVRQHPVVWPILLALSAALTFGVAGARRASAQQTVVISGLSATRLNGRPRAGVSLTSFDLADVEAIEGYTATSDASLTLPRAWPRGFPFTDTGPPAIATGRDLVWVVVWLKS